MVGFCPVRPLQTQTSDSLCPHMAEKGTGTLITLAAAAAALLQSCPTLCDPIDGSPPGFPSLGFSRQEHWSGLPFPSPMHESEKWKWSCSVMSDSSDPMDCSLLGSSVHGIFQARVLEWGATYKGTDPVHEGSSLMTPSQPNCVPSLLKLWHWRVKFPFFLSFVLEWG